MNFMKLLSKHDVAKYMYCRKDVAYDYQKWSNSKGYISLPISGLQYHRFWDTVIRYTATWESIFFEMAVETRNAQSYRLHGISSLLGASTFHHQTHTFDFPEKNFSNPALLTAVWEDLGLSHTPAVVLERYNLQPIEIFIECNWILGIKKI